ncbi:hypothetical protein [Acaryochloris sp. IP29b_bin.137]|uniref:hypothetical protein n=1 Tax=Acaryochloris sp. IP29b_bin.137 TaxID=2969217 RepID=UPI002633092F|nr:hypothetical protein [Acaryochloris sp. IP29b_bin.137]
MVPTKLLSQKKVLAHLLAVMLGSGWGYAANANPARQWRPVQPGKRKGISGLALVSQQAEMCQFLAVHDNKGNLDQPRLALLNVPAHGPVTYQSLAWPSDHSPPLDLEALTVVPNTDQAEFLAVTSLGLAYHLRLEPQTQTVTVLHTVQIPPHTQLTNIEGFALQQINHQLIAVWAHRGQDAEPGILFWGKYYPQKAKIVAEGSTSFQVPWPLQQVRHVSDVKMASDGVLYITAASDPGDQGPFQSATYIVGQFPFRQPRPMTPSLERSTLVPLRRFPSHKVEAIELVPGKRGGIVWASDDETFGSSLAGQCGDEPN